MIQQLRVLHSWIHDPSSGDPSHYSTICTDPQKINGATRSTHLILPSTFKEILGMGMGSDILIEMQHGFSHGLVPLSIYFVGQWSIDSFSHVQVHYSNMFMSCFRVTMWGDFALPLILEFSTSSLRDHPLKIWIYIRTTWAIKADWNAWDWREEWSSIYCRFHPWYLDVDPCMAISFPYQLFSKYMIL